MKILKRIGCMLLGVTLLSATSFAETVMDETRMTVTGKSEALIFGATVSLSVKDMSNGNIIVLDDKTVEKDAVVKFDTIDLKKFRGLKVFETNITSYGYNKKELITLIRRDEDGDVSEIISDTSAMPEKYLEFALGQLYDFFEKTDVLETLTEEQFTDLAAKIKKTAQNTASEEEFVAALENQVILAMVEKGTTEQIISNFEEVFNITEKITDYDRLTNTQKEELFRNITGTKHNSVDELISTLNENTTAFLKPASTGSTSGNSVGHSTGSSVTVTQPIVPIQPEPEADAKAEEIVFSDLENVKWAQEAVACLNKLGIINGYSDNTFKPDKNVTRAEFLKMLVQLTCVSETAEINFGDVKESDWFYSYVAKANAAGFANGDGVNMYPNNYITRQDMSVMCMNVLKYYGIKASEEEVTFTDKGFVADYAKSAIATLAELKVVSGMPDGSFMPINNTTRAEAANIIYKLWKILEAV